MPVCLLTLQKKHKHNFSKELAMTKPNLPNAEVNVFFTEGCGRCSLGGTPACKVHTWHQELALLRGILLQSGLTETRKWGVACYMHGKHNVVLLGALKSCATLSFFKGSLMHDPEKLLIKPGENSQAARYMKFTTPEQVMEQMNSILSYIHEAIQLEESGQKVAFKSPQEQPMCEELQEALKSDAEMSSAFDALTPGRQRGYILFFGAAKQSKTRMERIAKWRDKILQGKGMQD
jgi:uncharacterized protein YdeI (YjbR/CyaY-like superfamily)